MQRPCLSISTKDTLLKVVFMQQSGGTALRSSGNLCISNCSFINNVGINGGAILTAGALMLSASTFLNNYAVRISLL